MREYEAMIVLQPDLDDAGVQSLLTQVGDLVRRVGGEVKTTGQLVDKRGHVAEVTEGWGKRRLAYPIKGHLEGYYTVLRLDLPPESVTQVDGVLRINEDVLRYLIVRSEEVSGEE